MGLFVVGALGCPIERLDPNTVGMGVARLTAVNSAILTQAINGDTHCGFASALAMKSAKVVGAPGTLGTVTETIKSCKLSFGAKHVYSTDCNGEKTFVEGSITVSGSRSISGTITGDDVNPVIPNAPDAVTLILTATPEGFAARVGADLPALTWKTGTVGFAAHPHLAVSGALGVCSVATSDVSLDNMRYQGATVRVQSDGHNFLADVSDSNLTAQVGKWKDHENTLSGKLTVFGSVVSVPVKGDTDGLDPHYNPTKFAASYACTKDLKSPVSYVCPSVADAEAQGMGRLTTNAIGFLTSYLDSDTVCGFSNPEVLATPQLTGKIGERDGTATFTLKACTLTFAEPTVLYTDCQGKEKTAQGKLTVHGTKTLHGILTGDPTTPIIPIDRDPAVVSVRYDLEGLRVWERPDRSITYDNGSLSGTISPRTAQDTNTGACSMPTIVVQFEHLNVLGSDVSLEDGATHLKLHVTESDIFAQSGAAHDHENLLSGTVTVNDHALTLATGPDAILDEDYTPAGFTATWSCPANMKIAETDAQCNMYETLGANAARLLVQTAAFTASATSRTTDTWANGNCGAANSGLKKAFPDDTGKNADATSWARWDVGSGDACEVAGSLPVAVAPTDCVGTGRWAQGSAKVKGSFRIDGKKALTSVLPAGMDAANYRFDDVAFQNYSTYTLSAGQSSPENRLTLLSGNMTGQLHPIVGEDVQPYLKFFHNVFDIPTPVVAVPALQFDNVKAILQAGPRTFKLNIVSANLSALSGGYHGSSNFVTGTIQLDNQTVNVGRIPLDPAFNQSAFDTSYSCNPDLVHVIPAN